jgi:glutamyl/glutaminyl-tRNA synthetase
MPEKLEQAKRVYRNFKRRLNRLRDKARSGDRQAALVPFIPDDEEEEKEKLAIMKAARAGDPAAITKIMAEREKRWREMTFGEEAHRTTSDEIRDDLRGL